MMKIENFISKEYIDNGLNLMELGINEIAFKKIDALKILDELSRQHVAVLGGDVYFMEHNIIKPTYDNWFVDRNGTEWVSYVEESIKKAELYIQTYNFTHDDVYFTIVIAIQ